MNRSIHFILSVVVCLGLAACAGNTKKQDENYTRKKIYLTEQDYLDDLDKQAYAERREAKPNVDSNYIFELQPETQKNVYFFDERTRPLIPGEPSEREYKKTKRLWERPKRYSPDQYYGNQAASTATADTSSTDTAIDTSAFEGYTNGNFDYQ